MAASYSILISIVTAQLTSASDKLSETTAWKCHGNSKT